MLDLRSETTRSKEVAFSDIFPCILSTPYIAGIECMHTASASASANVMLTWTGLLQVTYLLALINWCSVQQASLYTPAPSLSSSGSKSVGAKLS